MMVEGKVHTFKSSYDDAIHAVDDCFNWWDPSTAAPIGEVCGLQ